MYKIEIVVDHIGLLIKILVRFNFVEVTRKVHLSFYDMFKLDLVVGDVSFLLKILEHISCVGITKKERLDYA